MEIQALRAELEQLFELDELRLLSAELLGLDPESLGGTKAKASFAKALIEHCAKTSAVEALCDAMLSLRPQAGSAIQKARRMAQRAPALAPGDAFAGFTIAGRLGEGKSGACYRADLQGRQVRLKLLHPASGYDQRGLQQFLTYCRRVAQVADQSLPKGLRAESIDGVECLSHDFREGTALSEHVAKQGAIHISEAAPWIRALLTGLAALHEKQLVHGNLKLENLITVEGSSQVELQDAGAYLLRSRLPEDSFDSPLAVSCPSSVAPEVLDGEAPNVASDIYAVGAVLYQLLTGEAPFDGANPARQALAHLDSAPRTPSSLVASIPFELDSFILRLLSAEPKERPASARETLGAFDVLLAAHGNHVLGEGELERRIQALIGNAGDEDAALSLEAAADEGADPERVAQAFNGAFVMLNETDPAQLGIKLALGLRAGRLFRRAGNKAAAERVYAQLLSHDPSQRVVAAALEDLRRQLGKYEELIEMWLERSELAEGPAEKAEVFAKIGALYEKELNDPAQALVAFTQAYCENPTEREYAHAVERIAGKSLEAWPDVLATCSETAQRGLGAEEQNALLNQMGHWCRERLARYDLALEYYQSVLRADAANDAALDGLSKLFRKLQQWGELAEILLRRADAAGTPEQTRALQVEAAEIFAGKLGNPERAQQIYERILDEDPGHSAALSALGRLYQAAGNQAAYVRMLERQTREVRGPERVSLMCRLAEAYEAQPGASSDALEAYEAVIGEDPLNAAALSGLDRLYTKTERFDRLLEALKAEIRIAATPRQRVALHERIATVYENEFLDPAAAAEHLEKALELDPRNENVFSMLERVTRTRGRFNDLLELYTRHASIVDTPRQKAALLLERGKLLAGPLGSPHQAILAFEAVLEAAPDQAEALTALVELKQQSGDAEDALRALETLAESSADPGARAENYSRAAKLLEKRNDLAGAVERYKLALDAVPVHQESATALRNLYLRLGNTQAAIDTLRHQIALTESLTARGRLTAELAKLAYERLGDVELAEQAARQALEWNETSIDAQEVLGGIALDQERYDEAAYRIERLLPHLDSLGPERSVNLLVHYVDALSRIGSTEAAALPVQKLRELAPDDPRALMRVARVLFEQSNHEAARELYGEILERFEQQLTPAERSAATYYHAESTRLTGQLGLAVSMLEEAADLDPGAPEPLRALASAYAELGDWEETWEANSRLLDLTSGEEKVQLLLEMAELATTKLDDRQRATRCLVAALDLRPDDRKLLTRLMQLYSEEKDWAKAYEVVLKLAEGVDDAKQRARYLMTAGMISAREVHDYDQALECFALVMDLDPEIEKAVFESISIHRARNDFDAAERLLKDRMKAASRAKDSEKLLESFTALGHLYMDEMDRTDSAVEAFEAAQTLDPENRERREILAKLYISAPQKYFDKGVETLTQILDEDPYRADAYSGLRKLYTEAKNPDGAWLLCQALAVLKLAAPDEERFYRRMRAEDPAYAQEVLSPEDWARDLTHHDQDPLLTELFAIIEPVVVTSRGYDFQELGYDAAYQVSLEHHAYPVGQTLHYAAGVMGIVPPPCFENTNDPGGLVFLDTKIPAISMGVGVLNPHLAPQLLAFISGHHLSYYRPGHFLRQLVGTGTGLKSWLFAAIKLISPAFPLAPDLEGPVAEAVTTLRSHLNMHAKDDLARAVSRLLQSTASLDLKRWVSAVDLTADRLGLLLAHDLATAVEVIRGGEEGVPGTSQQRLRELVKFAISPSYLRLRSRLGINLSI